MGPAHGRLFCKRSDGPAAEVLFPLVESSLQWGGCISWKGENAWLVPPIHLILRCVRMVLRERCHATLVVPHWKSAIWWPLLCPQGSWAEFIVGVRSLPEIEGTFVSGDCPWNFFSNEKPRCGALAVRICPTTCSWCLQSRR